MIAVDYELLTTETIPYYIQSQPRLNHLIAKDEPFAVTEVSHGNLNRVFDVRSLNDANHNLIVKQAPPFLNSVGESWSLDPARINIEAQALCVYRQITPQLIPEVYLYDADNHVIVMQNLDQHVTWRTALIDRKIYPHVGRDLGVFLGQILKFSAKLLLNEVHRGYLFKAFDNPELCQMTLDYVFTFPFQRHESNRYSKEIEARVVEIQKDECLLEEVQQMKALFSTCQQALIHGDLHTGSVMVSDSDSYIIDPEFAFVGPISFDLGALIGNLWLTYASHEVRTADIKARAEYQHYLEDMIIDIWQSFVSATENDDLLPDLSDRTTVNASKLLKEVAGMAGCIVLRRVIGTSGVEDIRGIEDRGKRAIVASYALNIGRALLLHRHEIHSIEDMMDLVHHLSKSSSSD